jgi:hypothetical protein
MPSVLNTVVVGTDGAVPVYNPNGRWSWWSVAANMYVPNVNDYVVDPLTYTVYIVTAVNPTTLVSTLNEITPPFINGSFTPPDVLFGVGPGTQADTYRVYLNQAITPFTLAVDIRLQVAGTRTAYCVIFQGADIGQAAVPISMMYDANGNFVSNNVPLELVAFNNINNYSIKTVSVCNTNIALLDGEIVTAVFYDAQANVVSKRQLLVENTSFIRSLNVSLKYITGISLDSPFLSLGVSNTIEFPLNVPINALNLQCVVSYGSTVTLPVDGTKVKVIGLSQYISTIVGQQVPLVLSYLLGPNEVTYTAAIGNGNFITEDYTLVTTNPDNSYDVKVYGYPEWGGTGVGYIMRFFMVNLDRNVFFDVTPQVTFASITGLYNPELYGYVQRKSIELNLSEVSGTFNPYIFTQLLDINLIETPSGLSTPWTISQVSGSDIPAYGSGNGLVATVSSLTGNTEVNITSGISLFSTWLQQVFNQTFPLVNPYNETAAPTPTHFELFQGTNSVIYPITSWNQSLSIGTAIANYSNIYILFINRTAAGDQYLSVAGMLVDQIN